MGKKRGLGRGLDALIGAVERPVGEQTVSTENSQLLGLDAIDPGRYQPRREFDQQGLRELAESIKSQGLVQPIVVRPSAAGRYEIIAGERRWRAARLAGLSEIPATVRELDDQAAMAIALVENIQREDLNVVEEAFALRRLQQEFDLTHEQMAGVLGKSRATITNLLRLLQLEPAVRELLERGRLDMGHARAILGLDAQLQVGVARRVVEKGLSVRETEALVRRTVHPPRSHDEKKQGDPDVMRLQRELSELTGARVAIHHKPSGKGQLTFKYNDLDEFQGLLDRFFQRP